MKISLKNLNLKEVERLSREQLKDVFGGQVRTTGATTCVCNESCVVIVSPDANCTQVCEEYGSNPC